MKHSISCAVETTGVNDGALGHAAKAASYFSTWYSRPLSLTMGTTWLSWAPPR